ncbi:isocitrate/isopropylmalate dehydrogenase family protein [Frankia sp. AiPa1]|uniref:isocitrate/isopropylmalate dehydrogenase family protein n=1 Tax=Frankia sp. AiPa1 TaxID=573492 RepID=UPI0035A8BA32
MPTRSENIQGTLSAAVAVLPGDGIGPEVIEHTLETLREMELGLDFDVLDQVSAHRYLRTGEAITDAEIDRIRACSAVLLGAVGDPVVRNPDYARGVLLRLRAEFDLYVNYRPVRLLHDRLSPLRDPRHRSIDLAVVRENTEGLYAGVGGGLRARTSQEVAVDTEITTAYGVRRVLDFAFSSARRRVCLVDKANAVPFGGALWQRLWHEAQARYPHITVSHEYVDAAAMKLVADPTYFEVIVTNNSYGDILSDLTAQLAGGLGAAGSANLNPETGFSLYEPVHGSAPDIAGKGVANPIGALLSAGLMLERLHRGGAARALAQAVRSVVGDGICTPDLGGTCSTREVAEGVRARLLWG